MLNDAQCFLDARLHACRLYLALFHDGGIHETKRPTFTHLHLMDHLHILQGLFLLPVADETKRLLGLIHISISNYINSTLVLCFCSNLAIAW
jgi:hypothetical protein